MVQDLKHVSRRGPVPPRDPGGAPNDPGMSPIVQRNIEAMMRVRARQDARRPFSDRVAALVTAFAGSMWGVGAHAVLFGGWLLLNSSFVTIVPHWDPYPFVMLAMLASCEGIFLSTFVLINQNRMQRLADQRAELDLQISLLSEHELSRLAIMIEGIAHKVGSDALPPEEVLRDVESDLNPEKIAEEIEELEEPK